MLPGTYRGLNNSELSVASLFPAASPGSIPSDITLLGETPSLSLVDCAGSSYFLETSWAMLSTIANLSISSCRGLVVLNTSIIVDNIELRNHSSSLNGTGIFVLGTSPSVRRTGHC